MPTYVIGDIQGCYDSLMTLLEIAGVCDRDQVWLVGDLVNRGPKSEEVLRWAKDRQDHVQIVLGNHDIHLLACTAGAKQSKGDTLESLLQSPHCAELTEWLKCQPVLFESEIAGRHIAMVHAGVNPQWSWPEVRRRARSIEVGLQSERGLEVLSQAHPTRKSRAQSISTLLGPSRREAEPSQSDLQWIHDLAWFTRVRAVDQELQPHHKFKGALADLPSRLTPWFTHYQQRSASINGPDHIYFGHWAALGIRVASSYTSLDSGCIWGRYLSALRIEDGVIFQTPTVERALTPKNLRT